MVIYTKKGDKGETGLYSTSPQKIRVSKNSYRIHAVGAVDELNSYLGVVISYSEDRKLNKILLDIQRNLLTIGSILGGSKLRFITGKARKFEKIIDELEGSLPPLKNFILPGGSQVTAHLHYARSVARRMERVIVRLDEKNRIKPQILVYVNRLSDFLFMLARQQSFKEGVKEEIWIGKKIKVTRDNKK
ncbi:ATP:cob(I)alamin adenosyltransferase [Candidatus Woesebacteria bacterium RIFCSPLOWO2_01_FULL_39_61]|uniref:Corrinoid adenosyltransferase n=1 Tax=Candidatus Woesebacteria bacterium RIFCSPHIGHO2_02_FULL_39_13 TaxID=1802505 RepID=A0A1F7Z2R3_9BACT|nr:MAG: ATP:cob(I)alamin adenosyltransferase [Candidatus Woesebacteria bacterium RIFCSPHIGHO2_01_FULL_39_95]OGM33933.1 MAG: ATP:cob(I)alamin adenosyltransferase [Candidatus Woesebacteria bacterium RIFCSPHIGHO2_02_FULL_39_13]OGM37222.1 MAG: ATP:cob(I)alamin adenosyltransferase [Candidatus Woesebacteria bacterium RIFCSPHIGHO2_12_FULL_40_20]OGM65907.1 MAG: ATP:cob(I)alamin adenosyltransferase [Candidatus Woesebacteria bacterium RIFCSPLOWO2_01_FULL_39_61]OGM74119.1 MAG: ATP:cob(I)alamin adenosyltra